MNIPQNKKVFFLSDAHLGAPSTEESLQREKKIVQFLDEIKDVAHTIFIVGDLFDFWFEYHKVVPKGFVRILGKLAELTDSGIQIHFFVGNHDMWMKNYFQQELNIPVYFGPADFEFNGRRFHVAHGDGLGPGDHKYKAMKKVFRNPVCQWLFGILPPRLSLGLAYYFSRKSRAADTGAEKIFLGEEKEWLIIYSKRILGKKHYDFFVFGHRHLPIDYRLNTGLSPGNAAGGELTAVEARYINLGDWMTYYSYAVFDGEKMEVKSYGGNLEKIIRN